MPRTEVLSVVSEAYPLVKTGGLADVAGALPGALKPRDVRVRTLIPGYRQVMDALGDTTVAGEAADCYGGAARLLSAKAGGLEVYVLDAPHLYDRSGGPYAGPDGKDFPDNPLRFAALSRMGASIGQGLAPGYRPDVVHAHDWQAGLTAAFLHYDGGPRPGTVFTVHNLAFQGQFDRRILSALGLPPRAFAADGVEYYGDIGFLKAGLRLSDRVTTVSPTYAAEICTPEGGMGLDGLLRWRADKITGILNGIDVKVWDPGKDDTITATYKAGDHAARAQNKAALQERLGLAPDPHAPLFGVVSRLSWQKGLDLLLAALDVLLAEGGQLALLGSGDPELEQGLRAAQAAHPDAIACAFAYDERLAHQIQAGADALLVPSRFEPCGLTQLCALRYGAVPIVARVGGLADTVIDATPMGLAAKAATGVQFSPVNAPMLEHAIRQAAGLYRQGDVWQRLVVNGMKTDVSWAQPARRYAELYAGLIAERAA